jgi:hypothetical protein
MKKQEKTKKYFIKDESLISVDDDMFRHIDISKNLRMMIDTSEPPFNIGIIGKWGLGKSSLINMILEPYKKNPEKYIIQEINAWKYEKESLSKVFLKQLWQGISDKKVRTFEIIKRELSDIINGDLNSNASRNNKKIKPKVFITIGVVTLASIVAFLIYKIIQGLIYGFPNSIWLFFGQAFLSYCKNVASILLFPIIVGLGKILIDEFYKKDTKKIEFSFPIETVDDYEIFLEEKIQEKLEINEELKIITVIDDLDRLSINKIVEALDAIKAFVGFKRCIFIVPFDDAILKNALKKRRINPIDSSNEIIESELILDKLFQYKIYLPPLLDFDIKEYAIKLVGVKIPDFIQEYCNKDCFDRIIRKIIIHNGVSTPRQVKKLINTFVSNYIVAVNREKAGKVENNFLSNEKGMYQIAKFSVLQADFNEFYDLLFKNFNYIEDILNYHRLHTNLNEIPDDLKQYFESDNDNVDKGEGNLTSRIKKEYENLINFLSRTEKYTVANIAPFLYLAQDDISRKTGDENQRRLLSAIESNNEETVRGMLNEKPDIAESINYRLNIADYDELSDLLLTTVNIFDSIDKEYNESIATIISEKAIEVLKNDINFKCTVLSLENVFSIYEKSTYTSGNEHLLTKYLDEILTIEEFQSNFICSSIQIFLSKDYLLSKNLKNKLKLIIDKSIISETIGITELIEIIDFDNNIIFDSYFGYNLLQRICKSIDEKNIFDDKVTDSLKKSFNRLCQTQDINSILKPVILLFKYSVIISKLDELITEEISTQITSANATKMAEKVLTLDLEKNDTYIFSILEKLKYEINRSNSKNFDEFMCKFSEYAAFDDLLIYCGTEGYFKHLEKTISSLTEDVFKDEKNDDTFAKTEKYFTSEQKQKLLEKIGANSQYPTCTAYYSRLPRIYEILSRNSDNEDLLNQCVGNYLLPYFYSYYNQTPYFTMTSEIVGYAKDYLDKAHIDKYVTQIASYYSSYVDYTLNAIRQLGNTITEDNMTVLFPKLISSITDTNYPVVFNIIVDNDKYFDSKNSNLSQYVNFLIDYMHLSKNPNSVIGALNKKFNWISRTADLIIKISEVANIDNEAAANLIAKFFDNKDELKYIADCLIKVLNNNNNYPFILLALSKTKVHLVGEIIEYMSRNIDDLVDERVLFNLLSICKEFGNSVSADSTILISKQLFSKNIDEPEILIRSLEILDSFVVEYFRDKKNELTDVLYSSYHETTSNDTKYKILEIIKRLKLKVQFKKHLQDDEMDFYYNNIK